MKLLEEQQMKSSSVQIGHTRFTTSVCVRTTYRFNEAGLRKALSAKVYDKFTERKLNQSKLKKAVEDGEVDAGTVAQYTETHESEPYIQLRSKELEDEQ